MLRRLALILAALLAAAGLTAPAAPAATRTVRLQDSFFSPSRVSVRPGSTVRFVWAGVLAHNLKGSGVPRRYLSPARALSARPKLRVRNWDRARRA